MRDCHGAPPDGDPGHAINIARLAWLQTASILIRREIKTCKTRQEALDQLAAAS